MPLAVTKPYQIIGPVLPVASPDIDSRHSMVALSPTSVVLQGREDTNAGGWVQKLTISGTSIAFGTATQFESNGDMRANVGSITSASATRVVCGHPFTTGGFYLTNVDVSGATPSLLSANVVVESNSTTTAGFANADQSGINVFSGIRRNGRNRFAIATVSGPTITQTQEDDFLSPVASGDLVYCTERTGPSTGRVVTMFSDGGTFPTESLVDVSTFTTTRTNIIQISLPVGIAGEVGNARIAMIDTTHAVLIWKEITGGGAGADAYKIQSLKSVDTGTPALSGSPLTIPGITAPGSTAGLARICKLDSNRVFLMYQKSGTTTGPIHYRILDVSGASPVDSGTDVELTSNGDLRTSADAEYLADGNVIVSFGDVANLGGAVGLKVLTGL